MPICSFTIPNVLRNKDVIRLIAISYLWNVNIYPLLLHMHTHSLCVVALHNNYVALMLSCDWSFLSLWPIRLRVVVRHNMAAFYPTKCTTIISKSWNWSYTFSMLYRMNLFSFKSRFYMLNNRHSKARVKDCKRTSDIVNSLWQHTIQYINKQKLQCLYNDAEFSLCKAVGAWRPSSTETCRVH